MKIALVRHSKVLHRDSLFSNGKQFNDGRDSYDLADIQKAKIKIMTSDFPVCYVSSMQRTVETAKMIYAGKFIVTDELVEVKNAFNFFNGIKLPTAFRKIIGRIAWFFNFKNIPETRKQSNARAKKFIDHLLNETHENTLIITHGFFMQCLFHELKKYGFKIRWFPFDPKHVRIYLLEKKD